MKCQASDIAFTIQTCTDLHVISELLQSLLSELLLTAHLPVHTDSILLGEFSLGTAQIGVVFRIGLSRGGKAVCGRDELDMGWKPGHQGSQPVVVRWSKNHFCDRCSTVLVVAFALLML